MTTPSQEATALEGDVFTPNYIYAVQAISSSFSYNSSTGANGTYSTSGFSPTTSIFGVVSVVDRPIGQISFASGQDFNILGASSAGNMLLLGSPGGTTNYQTSGYPSGGYYVLTNSGTPPPPDGTIQFRTNNAYAAPVVACFAEGVQIATPSGLVPVEDITAGEEVLTASGAIRRVIWVGHATVFPRTYEKPESVQPIRIKAGAIADGVPCRDLVVSPGHAVSVQGLLINAGCLVNDATIVQENWSRVRYYHIELERHDLIVAESMPCESYFDDDNRGTFESGGGVLSLNHRLDPRNRPPRFSVVAEEGVELDQLRHYLLERAVGLGWKVGRDPDLRLLIDGRIVLPVTHTSNRYWFSLAVGSCGRVSLISSSGMISQLEPGTQDTRRLGVAVIGLRVDGVSLDLAGPDFTQGFWGPEELEGRCFRWTCGSASVKVGQPARMLEIELCSVAPSIQREKASSVGLPRAKVELSA